MNLSVITKDMCIEGDLRGADNVNLAGEVRGSICIEGRLIVEQSGLIGGDVDAREVWIAGEIRGDIRATAVIHVTESGRVLGEVLSPRVIVDPGAVMKTAEPMETLTVADEAEPPVVDVISQPPRRVTQDASGIHFDPDRETARPRRRRVVVKKKVRIDK